MAYYACAGSAVLLGPAVGPLMGGPPYPPPPAKKGGFKLYRVVAAMKPTARLPVRGAAK